MAITQTLANMRESMIPSTGLNTDGVNTFFRQYRASFQLLVEGKTSEVVNYLKSTPALFAQSGLSGVDPIPIDGANNASLSSLLHMPSSVDEDELLYFAGEIITNYDKTQYGKMVVQVGFEIVGPKEEIDVETFEWSSSSPIQY